MTASRLVKAAVMVSGALVIAGLVLQRAVVHLGEARARAELEELDAEDARRAQGAAFETLDPEFASWRRELDDLDEQLVECKEMLPESRDTARDRFLAALRRRAAWSAELESLDWSDRSTGGAHYSAGGTRVTIDPSGHGWLGTARWVQHLSQVVSIECVDVSDFSDPSSPVSLDVTLYARPSEPGRMTAARPSAGEPGARGVRTSSGARQGRTSTARTRTPARRQCWRRSRVASATARVRSIRWWCTRTASSTTTARSS